LERLAPIASEEIPKPVAKLYVDGLVESILGPHFLHNLLIREAYVLLECRPNWVSRDKAHHNEYNEDDQQENDKRIKEPFSNVFVHGAILVFLF
jgi:hypothetical protein